MGEFLREISPIFKGTSLRRESASRTLSRLRALGGRLEDQFSRRLVFILTQNSARTRSSTGAASRGILLCMGLFSRFCAAALRPALRRVDGDAAMMPAHCARGIGVPTLQWDFAAMQRDPEPDAPVDRT